MKTLPALKLLLLSSTLLCTFPAIAGDNVADILKEGTIFGEARYRYEYVDQDGPAPITKDAHASTIRANIGVKSGEYKHFQALLEAQFVGDIGAENYNDTLNNKTTRPVVADPSTGEINQAWLSWSGLPNTLIKAGRQGINIDNQRFIGTVGWRQNDQTFDSVVLTNSSLPNLNLLYSYVGNVNRVFGDDHPLGDLNTDTHIVHAAYKAADWLTVTGYGYWLDINRAATSSSKTFGARLTGDVPIDDAWTFFYEAELATQADHGNNPANYNKKYYHLAPGIKGQGWTLKAGYEQLGGDGTNAFQTPLATLHAFNGWADKFLTTPAAGLEDIYTQISYKISDVSPWVDGTNLTAIYHDFKGNSRGDFGSELDLSVGKSFALPAIGQPFKNVDVLLKYADYNASDAPFTDTQKVWLQVGVKF